jgi:hypothetical protein
MRRCAETASRHQKIEETPSSAKFAKKTFAKKFFSDEKLKVEQLGHLDGYHKFKAGLSVTRLGECLLFVLFFVFLFIVCAIF